MAHNPWVAAKGIFHNNHETRIIYLEMKLWSLLQGYMSVAGYCWRLKNLANSMCNVGEQISDHTLVLNFIHDLSPHFTTQA